MRYTPLRAANQLPPVVLKTEVPTITHGIQWPFVFISLFLLPGGCAQPLLHYSEHDPPGVFSSVAAPSIVDGRVRFREIVCAVTKVRKGRYPDESACSAVLHNMAEPEQPTTEGRPIPLGPPKPLKVVIVTGIFGECIADYLLPFSDGRYFEGYQRATHGYGYMHTLGYDDVEVIVTPGRSSTVANGQFVYEKLKAMSEATTRDMVIAAYSKGVTDTLHALTLFPALPRDLRALVSVAGVVAGTPIADGLAEIYQTLLQ